MELEFKEFSFPGFFVWTLWIGNTGHTVITFLLVPVYFERNPF